MKKILQLFIIAMLTSTYSYADGICDIIHPSNVLIGQTANIQLDDCEECDNCYEDYGVWTINGPGGITINGNTYGLPYNTSSNPGLFSLSATFTAAGTHTIQFSANGNCNFDECNEIITASFMVNTPSPSLFNPPSNSIVSHSLIRQWNKAGYDKSKLPTVKECKVIRWCRWTRSPLTPYSNGYLVNVSELDSVIASTNESKLSVIYFPSGHYYFDKGATILLNKKNVVIAGAGANNTKFHIIAKTTGKSVAAVDFIRINKSQSGVSCLSIDTYNAFYNSYYKKRNKNSKFSNKSIIKISKEDCWVENVKVRRGYGCTVLITGGKNNSVLGCDFSGQWTIGGDGGTQGYGVQMANSDYNLIENNRIGFARHAVVIQGSTEGSSSETKLSSFNVVSYNYLYESRASFPGGFVLKAWDFTIHGHGKNHSNLIEGNLSQHKMAIDDEHGENGPNNTFYRNISKTQIEVEKINGCSGNSGQRFVLNKVFKRFGFDRWKIKADNHVIRGNSKCNSSGGSCDTSFSAGYCGLWPFGNNNYSSPLSSGQGQTCYLTSVPSFMSSLPVFNGTNNNAASSRYGVESNSGNCYSCRVPLCAAIPGPHEYELNDFKSTEQPDVKNNKEEIVVKEDIEVFESRIYPNPFTEKSTLEIETTIEGILNMSIYSANGMFISNKNIHIERGNNKVTLSRDKMNIGVYFINLKINDKTKTIKFIIK